MLRVWTSRTRQTLQRRVRRRHRGAASSAGRGDRGDHVGRLARPCGVVDGGHQVPWRRRDPGSGEDPARIAPTGGTGAGWSRSPHGQAHVEWFRLSRNGIHRSARRDSSVGRLTSCGLLRAVGVIGGVLRAGAGDCWVCRPAGSHKLSRTPSHSLLMLGHFDHGLAPRGRTTRASAYNRDAHSDGPGTRAADGHPVPRSTRRRRPRPSCPSRTARPPRRRTAPRRGPSPDRRRTPGRARGRRAAAAGGCRRR